MEPKDVEPQAAGPSPLTVDVIVGNGTEVDLMGALEAVLDAYGFRDLTIAARARAVDWLAAKYGSQWP